jgi:YD repeat-containing protein
VRAVYQDVTRAAAAAQLARRDSTVQCSPDDLEQEVTRWTDPAGRIRQLTWAAGSDDHAQTQRFYYDEAGRLRFIFVSRGAVNGTQQEERVYYASDGRLLRRLLTEVHGPGYPFGEAEPVWRPAEWLRRLCAGGR